MSFERAVEESLRKLAENVELKKEQEDALCAVVVEQKDCLCILPTGCGKSLIFQLIPFVWDLLNGVTDSCVEVFSPLNAIISDQIEKLESKGIDVKVFKHGNQVDDEIPTIGDTVKNFFMDMQRHLELGFPIHNEKSVLIPSQVLSFLEFVLNSIMMTVQLTDSQKKKLKNACLTIVNREKCTVQSVAEPHGEMPGKKSSKQSRGNTGGAIMDLPKLVPKIAETTSGSYTDDHTQGNTTNTPRVPETSPTEEKVEFYGIGDRSLTPGPSASSSSSGTPETVMSAAKWGERKKTSQKRPVHMDSDEAIGAAINNAGIAGLISTPNAVNDPTSWHF
ncbi:hypothetical protein ACROYT_G025386 [Oculina patagonica]